MSVPIALGQTVYVGSLIQIKDGYAEPWDETGQLVGLMIDGDADPQTGLFTGAEGSIPLRQCRIDSSGPTVNGLDLSGSGVTQGSVGSEVYCSTDNLADLTTTSTGGEPVGRISSFRSSTNCSVDMYPSSTISAVAIGDSASYTNLAVDVLSVPDGGASAARIDVGTGGDLKLYHTGTHSYIDSLTNSLYIQSRQSGGEIRFETGAALGRALTINSSQLVTCAKGLVVPVVADATAESALTATAGALCFRTDTSKHRGYNGSAWVDLY